MEQATVLTDISHITNKESGEKSSGLVEPVVMVEGSADLDIPDPFPFPPHYPPDIELGLQLKQLQPKQLAKFITRIANVMLLYKRYPTRNDYQSVARQVVSKYPFLKSPLDPTVSIQSYVVSTKCTIYTTSIH